jgi:hypothetical protein
MGQAKDRSAAKALWLASLTPEELQVVDAAQRLYQNFIVRLAATGMCYRLTFFLHLLLDAKGINTTPMIGYVNDGTDDVMMSHAWLEFHGKKIDLTIAQPERPHLNPPGQILILDYVAKLGRMHSYHLNQSEAAIKVEQSWLRTPDGAPIVLQKRQEHAEMLARASDNQEMRKFLDAAPDRMTFDVPSQYR